MAVLIALLTEFIRKRTVLSNVAVIRIIAVLSHLVPGSLLTTTKLWYWFYIIWLALFNHVLQNYY